LSPTKTVPLSQRVRLVGDNPGNVGGLGVGGEGLLEYVRRKVGNDEQALYCIRKRCASSLAFSSLIQYIFSSVRKAEDFVVNINSGVVSTAGFKVELDESGTLSMRSSPFLFNDNIVEFLGKQNVNGGFRPCYTAYSSALWSNEQNLNCAMQVSE